MRNLDDITEGIIDAAIQIHRHPGHSGTLRVPAPPREPRGDSHSALMSVRKGQTGSWLAKFTEAGGFSSDASRFIG